MKRAHRATLVVGLAAAATLLPAVAVAALSSATGNPGNAVGAAVLRPPGALAATAHATNSAANVGTVTLTWTDTVDASGTVTPTAYTVERQAAGTATWQAVGSPTYAAACASHTCTYDDTSAAFNTTYAYRIRSSLGGWTAGPTSVRLAASVAPTSAEDRQAVNAALNSVAYSAAGLVAVGQGGRILACNGACTAGGWQSASSPTTNDLNRVVFESGGRAWAVGAGGTVLTCASNCTNGGAWTSVNAGTTETLYGVYAESGYVAVVGTNRTLRYSTVANYATWLTGTVTAGTATSTLYGIAASNAKNVVVVGGKGSGGTGVIAACTASGSNMCGAAGFPLAAVTYASGSAAPTVDMRDVAYAAGAGGNLYAVGAAGNVYASGAFASNYARKVTGSTADLYGVAGVSQSAAAAIGDAFLRCTGSCASGTGGWAAGADPGTTNRLTGIAGTGSAYWAVGAAATIRYFNGTSWTGQSPPGGTTTVDIARLRTHDGSAYAFATTAALSPACLSPALVAKATVPARSGSGVTAPTVKVTVGYGFNGSTNATQVSLSTNDGATWSTRTLTANVTTSTVRTVDFTGTVAGSDADQEVQICVQASGGAGVMNLDLLHLDVEE